MNARSRAIPRPHTARLAVLLTALAGSAPALAQETKVSGTVPTYGQHHDFRATYNDVNSDIRNAANNAQVKYKDLAGDGGIRVDGNEARRAGNTVGRAFAAADYYTADTALYDTRENLAGGSWHCAPTSASMVYDWLAATKLKKLTSRGTEKETIDYFARAAKTNDLGVNTRATNRRVEFGTGRSDIWNALNTALTTNARGEANEYAKDARPTVKNYTYAGGAYAKSIDADRAVMLHYKGTAGTAGGHVVAGIGYYVQAGPPGPNEPFVGGAIVKDPWDKQTKRKSWGSMTGAIANVEYKTGNPRTTSFDSDWGDTMMGLGAIPDYGDAPYQYEDDDAISSSSKRAAAHRDNFSQYLGRAVSSETGKFDAIDDEDHVANTSFTQANMDCDDGASFLFNPDGSVIATVLSTKVDFSRDLDAPNAPDNLFLSVFADNDRDFDFRTGFNMVVALGNLTFNGTGSVQEILSTINLPAAADAGQYWVRFRLSRDANCDAYGLSEYGEVEDYLVPTPSAAVLMGIGALLIARRRRE